MNSAELPTGLSTTERFHLGERTIQGLIGELEAMGLVENWTEAKAEGGRTLFVETTFGPE